MAPGLLEWPIMKRTGRISLALSLLALAACADKPAHSASSTETTSARYPDSTMSSNVNDTSATGAATNESPNFPSQSPPITPTATSTTSTTSTTSLTATAKTGTATTASGTPHARGHHHKSTAGTKSTTASATRADTAVPAHDKNLSADASSTNGTYSNAAGTPGEAAPPPPQSTPKVTPFDQGNDVRDLKITQAIRREVISNGDLSFTAKNVKIITNGGHVTLKGQVKTAMERYAIEGTAIRVAGAGNVDDQIVVKP
ncbi:MAG: BON domain-containing protein [Polyangiaceae bacterium]